MKVDLPARLSPSSASTSPERMSRSTPDRAVSAPNRFDALRAVRNGGSVGEAAVISERRHPAEQVLPERRIARPIDEGLRQPVRTDVGRPDGGAPMAEAAGDEQRMPALLLGERGED